MNYGFPAHTDEEYLSTVIPLMKQAKISALLLPGIGTVDHLKMAHELGVEPSGGDPLHRGRRLEQHIGMARKLGMDTVGFLMMAHMNSPEGLVKRGPADGRLWRQLHLRHRLGRPPAARHRQGASVRCVKPSSRRPNWASTVTTTSPWGGQQHRRDRSRRHPHRRRGRAGTGCRQHPMEVLIAVCELMGIETGVDVFRIQDVAEDLVVPIMDFPIRIDRDALTLGYAGVYGSFLLFAKRAEKKYGVPARDILVEMGRRRMVGGQEDMIEDTAMNLARAKTQAA